jgi:dTDP-glucose pyrophosphorylase/CBS domain-containing protein
MTIAIDKEVLKEKMFVKESDTVKTTMKRMDVAGYKTVMVVDDASRLVGVVTDGDIRRWILADKSLQDSVEAVTNKNPITLKEGYALSDCKQLMLDNVIEVIPVVNKSRKVVDVILWSDCFSQKKHYDKLDLPVVIMAGGKGKRLEPFTDVLPKPLIPVGRKTIIEHIIERFTQHQINKVYISVNYKSELIKAYFTAEKRDYDVSFIDEEKQLGTVGALKMLGDISSPFFVTNCDILIDADYSDIYRYHKDNNCKATIISSVVHYSVPYGVLSIQNGGTLKDIDEKPEMDILVNTGLYLFEPDVLKYIPDDSFMDANNLFKKMSDDGSKIGVYPVSQKSWVDIGQWAEYKKALNIFKD